LTHVLITHVTLTLSPLYGYSIILDHCYFMYLYHLVHRTLQYTGHCILCIHLLHLTLLFHVFVSPLHGCSITLNTNISYTYITITWMLLAYVLISLLHRFVYIHALIKSVFLLYKSLFLLHGYSYIPVARLFPAINIDMIL